MGHTGCATHATPLRRALPRASYDPGPELYNRTSPPRASTKLPTEELTQRRRILEHLRTLRRHADRTGVPHVSLDRGSRRGRNCVAAHNGRPQIRVPGRVQPLQTRQKLPHLLLRVLGKRPAGRRELRETHHPAEAARYRTTRHTAQRSPPAPGWTGTARTATLAALGPDSIPPEGAPYAPN